jgi:hypothetical protein
LPYSSFTAEKKPSTREDARRQNIMLVDAARLDQELG